MHSILMSPKAMEEHSHHSPLQTIRRTLALTGNQSKVTAEEAQSLEDAGARHRRCPHAGARERNPGSSETISIAAELSKKYFKVWLPPLPLGLTYINCFIYLHRPGVWLLSRVSSQSRALSSTPDR